LIAAAVMVPLIGAGRSGRGREAPLGIVYQTDAFADKGVKILDAFPDDTHPPIVYPIAVVATSTNPADAGYLAYLKSPAARRSSRSRGSRTSHDVERSRRNACAFMSFARAPHGVRGDQVYGGLRKTTKAS
jgi:extracellular solute-binding protein